MFKRGWTPPAQMGAKRSWAPPAQVPPQGGMKPNMQASPPQGGPGPNMQAQQGQMRARQAQMQAQAQRSSQLPPATPAGPRGGMGLGGLRAQYDQMQAQAQQMQGRVQQMQQEFNSRPQRPFAEVQAARMAQGHAGPSPAQMQQHQQQMAAENTRRLGAPSSTFKKGGKVKAKCKRDGCAQSGKTKGKMR